MIACTDQSVGKRGRGFVAAVAWAILPAWGLPAWGMLAWGMPAWGLLAWGMLAWGNTAYCQPPADGELAIASVESVRSASVATIREQMQQLSDVSYRARQLARWRLEQSPVETMQVVPSTIGSLDHNAAAQLIDLVSALAMNADTKISIQARNLLETLADDVSAVGHLANNTLHAIADLQEAQAVEDLTYWGAYIGQQDFAINGRAMGGDPYLALRIGENFRGSDETIQRIRFLKSIESVYFQGPNIDSRFLVAISKLPKIKIIKLKRVQLKKEDLRLFADFAALEHLGLNYIDIDDQAVPELLQLPITQSLRLFGTQVTAQGEEQLVKQLDGIEIYRGAGGFLGVGTSVINAVVTIVTPQSAAHLAGIEIDDRLTHIDDVPIRNFDELREQLGKHTAGDKVVIRLLRGAFELEVDVELQEDPN